MSKQYVSSKKRAFFKTIKIFQNYFYENGEQYNLVEL